MSLFFELLQVALGTRGELSRVPNAEQWEEMLDESVKQGITGVMFSGIEQLSSEHRPLGESLLEWIGEVQILEAQNKLLDQRSSEVLNLFEKDGFEGCILKGQGNALMYPVPERRRSGDIDIWVRPKCSEKRDFKENRKEILKYVLERTPGQKVKLHHVDYPVFEDALVEVHFFPMYLKNPFAMRKLLKFFAKEADEQFSHQVKTVGGERLVVPTARFNLLYLLVHIYLHYLNQGIGLRHVIDYYYVVKQFKKEESTVREYNEVLQQLQMKKFAGAMMWVLENVCGMTHEELLCDSDTKEGERLLDEIMAMGNLGHYDTRYWKQENKGGFGYCFQKVRRLTRFVFAYPQEVLWDPWWRLETNFQIFTANYH